MTISGRLAIVLLLACAVAACGLISSPRDRALRRSPSFKDGYADGCAAAAAQGANYRQEPLRDESLYNSDSVYRAGWANGYQACRPVQSGIGTGPNSNPVPEPPIGH